MKRISIAITTIVALVILTAMRALGNATPMDPPSYRIESATPVAPGLDFTALILKLVEVLVRILREILAGLPVG